MNTLCKRLKQVSEAGVYRLNCPQEEMRIGAEESGFILFVADMANAHAKGEVLAELARAIRAPDWFGHNWDALADALCDLSWNSAPGYVLLLKGEPPTEEALYDILEATVKYWKLQGKAFWVFYS